MFSWQDINELDRSTGQRRVHILARTGKHRMVRMLCSAGTLSDISCAAIRCGVFQQRALSPPRRH